MTASTELRAGPDLDAEIAQAIGCVGVGTPAGTWWYLNGKTFHDCPKFSSSIEAAWLVVEKMRERFTCKGHDQFDLDINFHDSVPDMKVFVNIGAGLSP